MSSLGRGWGALPHSLAGGGQGSRETSSGLAKWLEAQRDRPWGRGSPMPWTQLQGRVCANTYAHFTGESEHQAQRDGQLHNWLGLAARLPAHPTVSIRPVWGGLSLHHPPHWGPCGLVPPPSLAPAASLCVRAEFPPSVDVL